MGKSTKKKRLWDAYRFPGCTPSHELVGVFGDPKVRVIRLRRRSKKLYAGFAAWFIGAGTTGDVGWFAICRAATIGSFWKWRSGAFGVDGAAW